MAGGDKIKWARVLTLQELIGVDGPYILKQDLLKVLDRLMVYEASNHKSVYINYTQGCRSGSDFLHINPTPDRKPRTHRACLKENRSSHMRT